MSRICVVALVASLTVTVSCSKRMSDVKNSESPQPTYSTASIAASGTAGPSPLAPGRVASIYGMQLGPTEPCHGSADPNRRDAPNPLRPNQSIIETQIFPDKLCDTEVHVGGVPAGLMYVSAGQINFRVPQAV